MPVTISNGSKSTRLWNGQESQRQIQGNVRVDSVFNTGAGDTLLTGLEAQERATYTGKATGNRLSRQAGYSSDPVEALAEWVVEMETYVNGRQGGGYTLEDTERDRTINGVLGQFGWQRSRAELYAVEWDIDFIRGEGIMGMSNSMPGSVSPQRKAYIDGWDLGSLTQWRCDKQQPFQVYPEAFAEPGENPIKSDGGAVRQFTLVGRLDGEDYRNQFDDHIRTLVGSDSIVEYESAFPGRSIPVMIRNYESTREAGVTRLGEYSVEMVQGRADYSGGA